MLFVTVGSQKFPFDRLLEAADEFAANVGQDGFAQTGVSSCRLRHLKSKPFLDRDEFKARMLACDTVLTHGGTGAIIAGIKAGKKVIAVPRLSSRGEHVDDHQIEIVTQFAQMNLIEPCFDVMDLLKAYERSQARTYRSYQSNTDRFITELSQYIDSLGGAN